MDFSIQQLEPSEFPSLLKEINDPPKQLYVRGALPSPDMKCVTVVGARNYSNYGKQVVETLIGGLRGKNIAIISGLALGIDGLAHRAALDAGLFTLAVPGSGLDDSVLYPRRHRQLAEEILGSGGGLLSEFEPDFVATKWSFPQRNRIMAGLAHAVLVIEASLQSGTLITSRLATDYNRDVLTVPGSIFSENAKGPHMLLRLGAVPITSSSDILETLGIETDDPPERESAANLTEMEQAVLRLLREPQERDFVIRTLNISVADANVLLMKMEMNNLIKRDHNFLQKI